MTTHANKKTPYMWHIFSALLILCLVVTYLVQINNQAEQSFVIRDLEEKTQELNDIIEDKELEVASVKALSLIATRAEQMQLEDPQDVTFIKIGLSTVARNEDILDISD